jgi:hypothetical protein
MSIKSKLVLAAALLLGTASGALADNSQFDVNIYRPTVQDGLSAYARVPAARLPAASVPARRNGAPAIRPFSPAERLWFERASSPRNS